MRAAVFAGPGRLVIEDRQRPRIDAPGDLLVEVGVATKVVVRP